MRRRKVWHRAWGTLACPSCDLMLCVHKSGHWHVVGDRSTRRPLELQEFIEGHTGSHDGEEEA